MKHNPLLLLLFLLTAFSQGIRAQNLLPCPPPSPGSPPLTGAIKCTSSCIWCNLNGTTGRNDAFLPVGANESTCLGNIPITNPRWYGFVAGSTILTIVITPANCQGADGLEAAIVRDCGTFFVTCAPGAVGGAGQPVILNASNLVVGQAYQLLIDGMNGDVCDFTISVLNGSVNPPPLGPLGTIQGPTQVCPKGTVTYSVVPQPGVTSYTWTAPAGAKINGFGNVLTLPGTTGFEAEIQFAGTGGNICVSASNACNPPVQSCLAVTNTPLPIVDLPDITVCYSELPYAWEEQPNTVLAVPGTYTLTSTPYQSYIGCDSVVRQKIKVLPLNIKTLPTIYLCSGESYFINGFEYNQAGSYQEILTAESGCDSIVNFNIVVIPINAAALLPDTLTCAVTSVPLSGQGSTTGNSVLYRWTNANWQTISNTITATAYAPGDYYIIVSNGQGGTVCMDTATVYVPQDITPPLALAGPAKTITCAQPTAQLQGTASVGPQYTYLWVASNGGNIVSGANTLNPIVNAVGSYKLRVTNTHNGCLSASTTTVNALTTPPTLNLTGGTLTCTTPNITIQTLTNATAGSTFAWTGPNGFVSSLQSPTVNVEGIYQLTLTDGQSGCVSTGSAQIIDNTNNPGATAASGAITCATPAFALNGNSPTSGVNYSWSGPNGFTSTAASPAVGVAGTYNLLVTGANGCTSTATAIVTLNNSSPGTTLAVSGNLNCNNNTVNISSSSSANPATLDHNWTRPDGSSINTGNINVLAASAPGVYQLVLTNTANGCTSTGSSTVVQSAPVTVGTTAQVNPVCFGLPTGSVTASAGGGNGAYAYQWSNGALTALNGGITGGTYTVTVTDAENCSAVTTVVISTPDELIANASAVGQSAVGLNDGSASTAPSGGTPGYTYIWSNDATSPSIGDLAPGFYTVTVTDNAGCTDVAVVNVNAYNCLFAAQVVSSNISCYGQVDGGASLNLSNGTAPYTYAWSTGASSETLSGLAAGDYNVTVTDGAGCPQLILFSIAEPDSLTAIMSTTTTTGPGFADGGAAAAVSGGSGAYTYLWSNDATTATISNVLAGLYTVTVTDANGCTEVQEVEVPEGNCGLLNQFVVIDPLCSGGATGEATAVITGGAQPLSYAWSSGGTAATETGLAAGAYTVSITDANGCSVTESVTLTDPTPLSGVAETVGTTPCVDAPEGAATVAFQGGTGDISILWSNNQPGPTASGLVAGAYTAVATDANGCTGSVTVVIEADDNEAPIIVVASTDVPLGASGTITLTTQNVGATVTDNCSVNNVVFTPSTFNCNDLGLHEIMMTAIDNSGNFSSDTFTVNIVDNSPPTLTCPASQVRCFGDNQILYSGPTATDNCLGFGGSFNLVTGLPSGSFFPQGTTTTTFSYTDAQGNTGFCSFEVTILEPLGLQLDTILPDYGNQGVGGIQITVTGSLSPYTFVWTQNGQPLNSNEEDLSGLNLGTYQVVVTDANGCSLTSGTFTVPNLVSTQQPDLAALVGVYPNPTSGQLNVVLPDDWRQNDTYIMVFDATGRRVREYTADAQKQVALDLSGFADGLYTLLIRHGEQQVAKKVLLQK